MKKHFIIFIFLLLFFPINVIAEDCDRKIENEYYNIIKNIQYNLDYKNDNEYSITFYNIPDNIEIFDSNGTIFNINNNESTKEGYIGGKTYNFIFRVKNLDCSLSINLERNIYIKKYNIYSEKEECQLEENQSFKLCNKSYQGTITDDIFDKELEKYKNNLSKEDIIESNDNTNNYEFNLLYLLLIFPVGIIITTIIFIRKRGKKYEI